MKSERPARSGGPAGVPTPVGAGGCRRKPLGSCGCPSPGAAPAPLEAARDVAALGCPRASGLQQRREGSPGAVHWGSGPRGMLRFLRDECERAGGCGRLEGWRGTGGASELPCERPAWCQLESPDCALASNKYSRETPFPFLPPVYLA